MFSEEKLPQVGQKTTKHWYKIFLLKHILWFLCSYKEKPGKVYTYHMLLSFKTSVTCKKNLTSLRTTVSTVKQLSSDITQYFAGYCSMSRPNPQACIKCYSKLIKMIPDIILNFPGIP